MSASRSCPRTVSRAVPNMPFPSNHRTSDSYRAVTLWKHAGIAKGAEGAVVAEVLVDASRVVNVVAREFADEGCVGNEVVKADGTGWLSVGGDMLRRFIQNL